MKKLFMYFMLAAMPLVLVSCGGGNSNNSAESYDYADDTDDGTIQMPSWAYGAWAVALRDDSGMPIATNYFVINKDGSGHWYIVNPDGSFTVDRAFDSAVAMPYDDDYDVVLLIDDGMSIDEAPMAFIDNDNQCLISNTGTVCRKRNMINFMYD